LCVTTTANSTTLTVPVASRIGRSAIGRRHLIPVGAGQQPPDGGGLALPTDERGAQLREADAVVSRRHREHDKIRRGGTMPRDDDGLR
jgi:hypothetical protein